jgi:hypothetical protein
MLVVVARRRTEAFWVEKKALMYGAVLVTWLVILRTSYKNQIGSVYIRLL